jgi:hypothetical protein
MMTRCPRQKAKQAKSQVKRSGPECDHARLPARPEEDEDLESAEGRDAQVATTLRVGMPGARPIGALEFVYQVSPTIPNERGAL